ncbi:ABC transporter ATP-binding protein [Halobacillus sp. ACCC02827]|uniref:ABC transporter ATP-binding protein n=1 Tax=Halobacillus sp. ACCC02827 TaxID=3052090 RepID=UPI0025706A34|nr:ABC transporter ATP-binding protein [Halobacillus sp. ACCC02827]WJE15811.1 ABC transporter ATP-binding protein [Halobacillus sp. ACCC02827]
MLKLSNVTKKYGKTTALDDVSMELSEGECVLLLGANGAGKTTLLQWIMGNIRAESGRFDWSDGTRQVGYVLQDASLMDRVTIKELIQFTRKMYPDPLSYEEVLQLSGLTEQAKVKTDHLSIGQKRKLIFALALVGRPKLLIMDEPTAGMDVSARKHVYEQIRQLKQQGMTILMTTHLLQEASLLGDRVLFMEKGRLKSDQTVSDIEQTHSWIRFDLSGSTPRDLLEGAGFQRNGLTLRWELKTDRSDEWITWLVREAVPFRNLTVEKHTVEHFYEELLGKEGIHNENMV